MNMATQPRKIKQIIEPQLVIEGAGVLLRRSFGPSRLNPFDPFLLFDHFAFNDPNEGPIRGFPPTRTAASRPLRTCSKATCATGIAWAMPG